MTEPDEAVERLTAQLNELVSVESVGVMVKTADLAAVLVRAERIKALEARVAELEAEFDEGPICQTSASKSEEPQTSDRALLKEPDQ